GNSKNISNLIADNRKSDFPQVLRDGAVRYGLRRPDANDFPFTQRLQAVIASLGLYTVHGTIGRDGAGGEQGSGQKAAAAQRDKQRVEAAHVFQQFLNGGTLPRDDVRM